MFVGGGSVWNAKAGWPTAALDPTTVQVAPPAHHRSRTHCLCLKLVDAPSPSGDSTSLASRKTEIDKLSRHAEILSK
jgi:hypothetical protein